MPEPPSENPLGGSQAETKAEHIRGSRFRRVLIVSVTLLLVLLLMRVAAVKWRAVGDPRPTRDSPMRQEIQRWIREDLSDPGGIVISCGSVRRQLFGSGSWLEVVIDESKQAPGTL